jgi:alpha-mannosidase
MDKIADIYRGRLASFTKNHQLGGMVYKQKGVAVELAAWAAPDRVAFAAAVNAKNKFEPIKVGHSFGPAWSTHWVKVDFTLPAEWKGGEVHLLWDSNSEETVWTPEGVVMQGMNGSTGEDRRAEVVVTYKAAGG